MQYLTPENVAILVAVLLGVDQLAVTIANLTPNKTDDAYVGAVHKALTTILQALGFMKDKPNA